MTCTRCPLHITARNVCVAPRGSENPLVLFVTEAPDRAANAEGRILVGEHGDRMAELMRRASLDPSVCRFTSLIRCAPWADSRAFKIRSPESHELDACCNYLEAEIQSKDPVYIVPMGAAATEYFTGDKRVMKMRGVRHAAQLPSLRYRYLRMRKLMKLRGIEDKKLDGKTVKQRENALDWAQAVYGYEDVPLREYTVFPTLSLASLYANPAAEQMILSDLNFLASKVAGTNENLSKNYEILTNVQDVVNVAKRTIARYKSGEIEFLAMDLETGGPRGLVPYHQDSVLCTIAFTPLPGEAYIVPIEHRESPFKGDFFALKAIGAALTELFTEVPTGGHNFLFDYCWAWTRGIRVGWPAFDTELEAWTLFNKEIKHDLEFLTTKFTDFAAHKQEMKEAQAQLPKAERYDMNNYDLELVARYNGYDTDGTHRLHTVFRHMLEKENLLEPHRRFVEASLEPVGQMQLNGCPIDLPLREKLDNELTIKKDELFARLEKYGLVATMENLRKKKFKLTSSDAVATLLFDVLGFEVLAYGKPRKNGPLKGKRVPSADKKVLAKLLEIANEKVQTIGTDDWKMRLDVLEIIKDWKGLNQEQTKYMQAIKKHIGSDGYVHATFGIRKTNTGRQNAKDPPIQTVPWHSDAKKVYKSRFRGGLIWDGDYSQMELRVMCMVAGDEGMRKAFEEGRDIHTYVTARLMSAAEGRDVPESEVPSWRRRRTKTVIFGLLYGRGAAAIATQEKISKDDAKELIASIFREFPAVDRWIKNQHRKVMQEQQIWSPVGFRRWLPLENNDESGQAKRRAVNTPIQGAASDLCLDAMNRTYRAAKKAKFRAELWNMVHDAFCFDLPPGELYDFCILATKEMVERPRRIFPWINLPLVTEIEVGVTWGHKVVAHVLDNREIKFKGAEEHIRLLEERLREWPEPPTFLGREEGESGSEGKWVEVHYWFPYRSKDEPVYEHPRFTYRGQEWTSSNT